MKPLRVVLIVTGILCATSVFGLLAPWPAVANFIEFFGYQPPPADPLVIYFVRLSATLLTLVGIFFLVLSTDPLRYRPMLTLAAAGLLLCAAVCLLTGLLTQMRPPWYLTDAIFSLLAALLILKFWPKQPNP